ncbi:hypothetical protein B2J88_50850 [Rhodococcus sp. SRB_17]|nr:hypothetical protein [Rhodococcus sp. SRB_17]
MGSVTDGFAAGGRSFFRTYKRILLFCMVGTAGAVFDFGTRSVLLSLGLNPAVSRGISFAVGSSLAYSLNSRFTFAGNRSAKEKVRATLVYLICFLIAIVVDGIARRFISSGDFTLTAAWVISQTAATSMNFLLQKYYVFSGSD